MRREKRPDHRTELVVSRLESVANRMESLAVLIEQTLDQRESNE
jgi:hypothetical protein